MQLKRRAIMVGATFFLAAATGHVMQGGGALFNPFAGSDKGPEKIQVAKADPVVPMAPALADLQPTAITPLAGNMAADLPAIGSPSATPELRTVAADDCAPTLVLASAPAAMVDLSFSAPCMPNARVVVAHAGLTVTGVTSADGKLTTSLPALTEIASFTVTLPGGAKTSADVAVPSLKGYDRVAVQWQGDDAFELHAFEFGADYGDAGHVSAATPRSPASGQQATGGFLTQLGSAEVALPMLAQVYTFPSGRSQQEGVVRLTIEAQVTETTCGHDMLGETLQVSAGGLVKIVDLTLSMPGCEVTGDYLVLKNLLPDVKIARN